MKLIIRPLSHSIIAINLNQTVITKHLATLIIKNLIEAGSSVRKVAFVGIKRENLALMKRVIKIYNPTFVYQYFDDFVKAKDWLI